MIQPTQVLRSNAPPLRDETAPDSIVVHHGSRVLQEQSGNRQLNDYTSAAVANGYEHKYVVNSNQQTSPTENAWPATSILIQPHQPQYHSVPAHFSQPYVKQAYGYGSYCPRGWGHHTGDDEQRVSHSARQLWKRFQDSDSYRKYRSRQHKDEKGKEEQKWPDHLEEAFFRALVKYPPMGRRKSYWKDKQRGRNELIADHIQELTGVGRDRKQVSSHIQVLKPFVEHDPLIMRYFSTKDTGHPISHRSYSGYHGSSRTAGRRASMYRAAAQPQAIRQPRQAAQTDMSTVRQLKHQLDIFAPKSFSMFVQRKVALSSHEEQYERLHTYTMNIEDPLGHDKHFQDRADFQSRFPQLAAMDKQTPLDCNVVVANASLAFPTEDFRDKPSVELGISFVCGSRSLPAHTTDVMCRTTFYKAGVLDSDAKVSFEIGFQQADDGDGVTTSVMKFGSGFWARELSQIAAKLKAAPTEDAVSPREDASQALQEISVIQEVVVLDSNKEHHERILVMMWQFRHSSAATGRVSWRRIIIPQSETTNVATPVASQHPEPKTERVDSMYEYVASSQYPDVPVSQSSASQTALQSPFEYSESSSGAALASSGWPTAVNDCSVPHTQPVPTYDGNEFDFSGGNISVAFDPNSLEYGTFDSTFDANAYNSTAFDSTAFDFDSTGVEFAQDPALEQSGGQWYDMSNTVNTYDAQTELPLSAVSHDGNYAIPQARLGSESQPMAQPYSQNYASQQQYEQPSSSAAGEEDVRYAASSEQQAFGGAGQDGFRDDALAALADTIHVARNNVTEQNLE